MNASRLGGGGDTRLRAGWLRGRLAVLRASLMRCRRPAGVHLAPIAPARAVMVTEAREGCRVAVTGLSDAGRSRTCQANTGRWRQRRAGTPTSRRVAARRASSRSPGSAGGGAPCTVSHGPQAKRLTSLYGVLRAREPLGG